MYTCGDICVTRQVSTVVAQREESANQEYVLTKRFMTRNLDVRHAGMGGIYFIYKSLILNSALMSHAK